MDNFHFKVVSKISSTTGMNSREYLSFFAGSYGAKVKYLKAFREEIPQYSLPIFEYHQNGIKTVGSFPKGYGTIDYLTPNPIDFGSLITFIKKTYPRHNISIKLRQDRQIDKYTGFSKDVTVTAVLQYNKKLTAETLLSSFSKKTRNQVRRSLDAGFIVKHSRNPNIKLFYRLYLESMSRLNTRPKSIKYFNDLKKALGKKLVLTVGLKDREPAGMNLSYISGHELLLLFNVSKKEYWSSYINDFLYYHTIKQGLASSVNVFDFGPAMISDKSHLHFKEGFGAKIQPVYSYEHDTNFFKNIYHRIVKRLFFTKLNLYVVHH